MRLPLEALAVAALLAGSSRAAPVAQPAEVKAVLDKLDAVAGPLKGAAYERARREPVLPMLAELRGLTERLDPPATGDAVLRLRRAADGAERAEIRFWSGATGAARFPAGSADGLGRDAAELNALFAEAFPATGRSSARFSAPPAIVPPPEAAAAGRRAAAQGRAALADPGRFFDGGSRGSAGQAGGAGGKDALARRGVVLSEPAHITDLGGRVPSPVSASESACREASGGGAAAKLCKGGGGAAYLAPVGMGLLDSVKQQFGTVAGVVSTLAMLAVGILMSALSGGVGLILTLIRALLVGAMLWMALSMLRRLVEAIRVFSSTSPSDPRHWLAAREFGKLGGELILAVLLTVAGVKIGQKAPVKEAVGSMVASLRGQLARLGPGAAATQAPPSAESLFGEAPAPARSSGLRPPEPPPARGVSIPGRSLSEPASLRGATPGEVTSLIPEGWVQRPMRTGRGTIYEMPGTRGADIIQISRGNPGAPDALHQGAYVKIVRAGRTTRVELKP